MGQNTELQQGMNRDVVAPRIAREIILAEFNEILEYNCPLQRVPFFILA